MFGDVLACPVDGFVGKQAVGVVTFGPNSSAIERLPHAVLESAYHCFNMVGVVDDPVEMPGFDAKVSQVVVEFRGCGGDRLEQQFLLLSGKKDGGGSHQFF